MPGTGLNMNVVYNLILLVNSSFVGAYPTEQACIQAARAIYEQAIDPYRKLGDKDREDALDLIMKYRFPRDYRCVSGVR